MKTNTHVYMYTHVHSLLMKEKVLKTLQKTYIHFNFKVIYACSFVTMSDPEILKKGGVQVIYVYVFILPKICHEIDKIL